MANRWRSSESSRSSSTLPKAEVTASETVVRQRLHCHLESSRIMRWNALRALRVDENVALPREAMINKLYWANLHRDMGELAIDVLGPESMLTRYSEAEEGDAGELEMGAEHKLFFFSRSDTIYGGSDEIQRNVIGGPALSDFPANPADPTHAH